MSKKYAKKTRNFSTTFTPRPHESSLIYVVPRIRAGPSYKSIPLLSSTGTVNDSAVYCPISKGYPMQDVSSFTLGPVAGEGLCVVNAAFSKQILTGHIQGNGVFDAKTVGHWKYNGKPKRTVEFDGYDRDEVWVKIDGVRHHAITWLTDNMSLWFDEWDKWRRSIALCSEGSFHWNDKLGDSIAYYNSRDLIDIGHPPVIGFVEWKKNCYIRPAYHLIVETSVYLFLDEVYKTKTPLALVHPKGMTEGGEVPLTREAIRGLYDDPHHMACMPYVVVGRLLEIPVYKV